MKRKSILFLIAGIVVAASLLAFKAVNARRIGSDTTKVSIDGMSFIVENPSLDSRSALQRELARLGVDVPEGVINFDETPSVKPAIPEKPMATKKTGKEKAPRVPEGFKAEHTLKLSGESGTVELIMGNIKQGNGSAAAHLNTDRWTQAEMAGDRNFPKIFRKSRGKETDIVCLDEKKGTFLLLRRVER